MTSERKGYVVRINDSYLASVISDTFLEKIEDATIYESPVEASLDANVLGGVVVPVARIGNLVFETDSEVYQNLRPLQKEVVALSRVKRVIDSAEEVRVRVEWIKDYLRTKAPSVRKLILGLSLGQDSTLAGKLCQLAVDELSEETGEVYEFVALRLPYGVQLDREDEVLVSRFIQPDILRTIDIKPAVDSMVSSFNTMNLISKVSDFTRGNTKARVRMTFQYMIAGQLNGLVVGTDHAAEWVTGFYTKYGDGASDLNPLTGLTKSQGRELLIYLGAPERLYNKIPTADLLDEIPLQSDETELGLSYAEIDAYLTGCPINPESADKLEVYWMRSAHKRKLPATPFDED